MQPQYQNDLQLLFQQQQLLGQAFPHFMQTNALQQELLSQLHNQNQLINQKINNSFLAASKNQLNTLNLFSGVPNQVPDKNLLSLNDNILLNLMSQNPTLSNRAMQQMQGIDQMYNLGGASEQN